MKPDIVFALASSSGRVLNGSHSGHDFLRRTRLLLMLWTAPPVGKLKSRQKVLSHHGSMKFGVTIEAIKCYVKAVEEATGKSTREVIFEEGRIRVLVAS